MGRRRISEIQVRVAGGAGHAVEPIAQQRATMHLDTIATMVDVDAMVMYPAVADSLRAWTVTAPEGVADDADPVELTVTGPRPFVCLLYTSPSPRDS